MVPAIRFVHCAGFRFDSPSWDGPTSWAAGRNQDLWKTFDNLLSLCQSENIDFLFVTGNLFEQEHVRKETVERVAKSFVKLDKIRIFITPGEKDPLVLTSAYRFTEWPDNVHIFPGGLSCVEIPSLNVKIYGESWTTYRQNDQFLKDFPTTIETMESAKEEKPIQFMLLHTDIKQLQIDKIASSGLIYLALGSQNSWSGVQQAGDTLWADCGPIEARSFQDRGPHGVLIGEVKGNKTKINFLELGQRRHYQEKTNNQFQEEYSYLSAIGNIFSEEIEKRIVNARIINENDENGENKTYDNQKINYWKLVQKIGLTALTLNDKHSPKTSLPNNTKTTNTLDITPTNEDENPLNFVWETLVSAQKRLQEQSEKTVQLKAEYESLKLEWDKAYRQQEEQRRQRIELKNLQISKVELIENINEAIQRQKRLSLLAQNPCYRELRQMQGALADCEERCQQAKKELTVLTHDVIADANMLLDIQEECLQWALKFVQRTIIDTDLKKIKRSNALLEKLQNSKPTLYLDKLLKDYLTGFTANDKNKKSDNFQEDYLKQQELVNSLENKSNQIRQQREELTKLEIHLNTPGQTLEFTFTNFKATDFSEWLQGKVTQKLRICEEAEKELNRLSQQYKEKLQANNLSDLTLTSLAKELEPLAELEREMCLSLEKKEEELSCLQKKLEAVEYQIKQISKSLTSRQSINNISDIEQKLSRISHTLQTQENLQKALEDTEDLLRYSARCFFQ